MARMTRRLGFIVKPEMVSLGIGLAFGCSGAFDRGPRGLGRPKIDAEVRTLIPVKKLEGCEAP
jgi:hypothetical protein